MLNSDIHATALLMYHHTKTKRLDLTTHSVISAPDEGMFTLGAGRAFSDVDKDALIDILLDTNSSVEFLDTRILVKSRSHLVWYNPPQSIEVLFKGAAYSAPIPGLVYIAESGRPLRCFAFKGKARPTPDTKLFYVPLGNVYKKGTFCIGNAIVPKDNALSSIPGWERFVLQCTNTHLGGVTVLKDHVSYEQMIAFYKDLSETGAKAFPARQLVKVKHESDQLTVMTAIKMSVEE